jgi:hypothetical protein
MLAVVDHDLERVEVRGRMHALQLRTRRGACVDGGGASVETAQAELGLDRDEAARVLGMIRKTERPRVGVVGRDVLTEARVEAKTDFHAGSLSRPQDDPREPASQERRLYVWPLVGAFAALLYALIAPLQVNGDGIGYLKAARAGAIYPGHPLYLPLLRWAWRMARWYGASSTLGGGVLPARLLSAGAAGLAVAFVGAWVSSRTRSLTRGLGAAAGLFASAALVLVGSDIESYAPALAALAATLFCIERAWFVAAGVALALAAMFHIENLAFFLPAVVLAERGRVRVLVAGGVAIAILWGLLGAPTPAGSTHGFRYPLHLYTPLVALWGMARSLVYAPYLYEASRVKVVVASSLGALFALALIASSWRGPSPISRAAVLAWVLPYGAVGLAFFASDSERWIFLLPLAWLLVAARARPDRVLVIAAGLIVANCVFWLPTARDARAVDQARAYASSLRAGDLVVSPGHGWDESIVLYADDVVPFPLVYHAALRGDLDGLARDLDAAMAAAHARGARVVLARMNDDSVLGWKELAVLGIDREAVYALLRTRGL